MPSSVGRNDHEYTKRRDALKRRAKKNNEPCAICHEDIDYGLEWKHPMSFTADHVEPIANGGHMHGELQPAHRSCNSRRGAKPTVTLIERPVTKRKW